MFTAILEVKRSGDASMTIGDTLGTLHEDRADAFDAARAKWGDRWQRAGRYTSNTKVRVVDVTDPEWAYLASSAVVSI